MKNYRMLCLVILFLLLPGSAISLQWEQAIVEWLGFPVFSREAQEPGYWQTGRTKTGKSINVDVMADTDYEIGLRSDGFVVWRKKQ